MMKNLKGYRTTIAMGIALAVALWQHFVGPLPVVDQDLWNVAVPVTALLLRQITTTPPGTK